MAKMTMPAFEKSKFDKEKKGMKEGSPAEVKADKAAMKKAKPIKSLPKKK